MKANEMPERIYIFDYNDAMVTPLEGDTTYVREEAFIEKACEWLFNQANYYTKLKIDAHNGGVYADFYADKMVEDFKKAMAI